jgi:hypothetical protein
MLLNRIQAYEKLITSIPPSKLKLTPSVPLLHAERYLPTLFSIDDEIYEHLLSIFPELAKEDALRTLDEDDMKSAKGKERWRSFIMPVRKPKFMYWRLD